jgi:hypothetical protein
LIEAAQFEELPVAIRDDPRIGITFDDGNAFDAA